MHGISTGMLSASNCLTYRRIDFPLRKERSMSREMANGYCSSMLLSYLCVMAHGACVWMFDNGILGLYPASGDNTSVNSAAVSMVRITCEDVQWSNRQLRPISFEYYDLTRIGWGSFKVTSIIRLLGKIRKASATIRLYPDNGRCGTVSAAFFIVNTTGAPLNLANRIFNITITILLKITWTI